MAFKFYLDGIQVSDPVNWDDFTETIERDSDIKGILPKYELKLNLVGGGYEYLYNKYIEHGFCYIVELIVEQSCSDDKYEKIFTGNIFISDCKFNLNKCYVECSVEDNNYGSRIRNNKSIKTSIDSDKSKNGVTIIPANYVNAKFFNPADGSLLPDTRRVYSLYECFKYLVSFMSDGKLGFESDFIYNIETGLSRGVELRLHGGVAPFICFKDLFKEVDKKIPIGFTIVERNGTPTLKIEDALYFYNLANSLNIDYIEDLEQSFNNEVLYSNFNIGGKTAYFDPLIHTFIPRQFIGFNQEEYFLGGVCNIDSTLDLESGYIIDSNIIEELVVSNTSNRLYDEDTFFIQMTQPSGIWTAVKYPQTGGGFYYNGDYTNEKIANRNDFSGDAALYSGLDTSGFKATITDRPNDTYGNIGFRDFIQYNAAVVPPNPQPPAQTSAQLQTKFNDDSTPPNYNLGAHYDTSTWRYVVPLSGDYFFYTNIAFKLYQPANYLTLGINRKWRINVTIKHYESSGLIVNTYTETFPSDTTYYGLGPGEYNFSNSKYFSCSLDDYVEVWVSMTSEPINRFFPSEIRTIMNNTSEFKSLATSSGGGIVQEGDTDGYKCSKLEFERPLSNQEYNNMKADLSKSLNINHDGNSNKRVWIRKTSRKLATGEMKWEMISDKDNSK